MAMSDSRAAYIDVFKVLDQAMEDPVGVRIKFTDNGDAMRYRLRINYARKLDRQDNREIYDVGHKMYGRSIYDPIQAIIEKDGDAFWLYVRKADAIPLAIENLTPAEENNVEQ